MAVKRFQDLVAWQRARTLAAAVYQLTEKGRIARDFGLRDQMRRSGVSVMANIAEGLERNRPAEFLRFLDIAKASCAELRSHSYVAFDVGYFDSPSMEALLAQADEFSRILGGLQQALRRRADRTRDSGLGTRDTEL